MNSIEIATFLLSLAGALAWTPFIYDKFIKSPRIEGRLVGLTFSPKFVYRTTNLFSGEAEILSGIGYFPKFTFVSLVKDFNVSKITVEVKYPGESLYRQSTIFYSAKTVLMMEGESVPRNLTIPTEEHINSLLTLERNKPISVFIPFCVNKPVHEHFDTIKITFIEFDGVRTTVLVNKDDIDIKNIAFEEKYWS